MRIRFASGIVTLGIVRRGYVVEEGLARGGLQGEFRI